MDFEKYWDKALRSTEIIRSRVQSLYTLTDTHVPYVLLSESSINIGDTVVRKGQVLVKKPSLILPPNNPQFDGFDFKQNDLDVDPNSLINFLLVRGVVFPSLKYDNETYSLDVFEGKLSNAIKYYNEDFQKHENVNTGLIVCEEDCWQFSLLIFVCTQIARNADTDIKKLMQEFKKRDK